MKSKSLLFSLVALTILLSIIFVQPIPAQENPQAVSGNAGWEEIGTGSASGGGISNNSGNSIQPSLAVTKDGAIIVAWEDYSGGDREIYVRRWNGSTWAQIGSSSASGGGISDNNLASGEPSIAVGSDGNPIVAWMDFSGGDQEIYVKRWNGSNWVSMGNGSASGGGISNNGDVSLKPAIAIAPDGKPIVTWHDRSGGNQEIYVKRWNGSSWDEIGSGSASGGGISNNSNYSWDPAIAIAPDGTPIITWSDNSGGGYSEIYVRRWNGSSWVTMGSNSASGSGISSSSKPSERPSIAIGPDNKPIIAWQDSSNGEEEIYVRGWNGSSWVELGPGSASGGGISNNAEESLSPSIAIGPNGQPIVSWYNRTIKGNLGTYDIYAKTWNGSSWVEVGSGSASGGGISDTNQLSGVPSLAITLTNMPVVAWQEGGGEIYARRYGSTPTTCFSLTINISPADGGIVNKSPAPNCSGGKYKYGTNVTLTAVPADKHPFPRLHTHRR